ncbi:MAG TPA: hypothetical protein VFM98_05885 [Ramlibacter sp.]|uniref:hypothetical protein n=1 Tax=Ramlibacter sp. TaxID=1917967 RepID=UPI002D80013B|nr:hypothetical protein [Ramlibacter sp.]HET8745112.1 hypothetical protein [Ramlibacter sp.]
MELLRDAPPGFDPVANAFAMAKLLPSTHRMGVKIGLARDGLLFAVGQLEGYRQVNFFAEHLRNSGWHEHLLGGETDMQGCDMLFAHPADGGREDDDPSFIRRAPVELWPAKLPHADR